MTKRLQIVFRLHYLLYHYDRIAWSGDRFYNGVDTHIGVCHFIRSARLQDDISEYCMIHNSDINFPIDGAEEYKTSKNKFANTKRKRFCYFMLMKNVKRLNLYEKTLYLACVGRHMKHNDIRGIK